MSTNFPVSLDTLANPAAGNATNSPSHASQHADANDAIEAIEAKLGTGASTPVVSRLLFGTGTGTSAWTQLTSAQLAATLSDETGTGSAVFATTPTLVTPKVDTINENTSTNGVTIDGLNIKDNKLNTNDSVVTTNITDANVTAPKMNNSGTWNSSWAYQSYTPVWSATGTAPALGDGTFTGKFTQIGKTIFWRAKLTFGSTTTFGTLSYRFTLPLATAETVSDLNAPMGDWTGYTGAANLAGKLNLISSTTVGGVQYSITNTGQYSQELSATTPTTFTNGMYINLKGFYEAA